MNFIQIFQTQSFRNFVENIIEAEYNMKIYHADMNLTFQYIYTKVFQEIDTCLTCFKLHKYIFSYSIKQNKRDPETPHSLYITSH